MSDNKYQELFEHWRNKSLSAGFTLNQFRTQFNFFVEKDNQCELTNAVGAKMAYQSLVRHRNNELMLVNKEMENMQWF
jgi:hypothetical protein